MAAGVVDIAVPIHPGRVAGASMAGFRGQPNGPVDMQMVPYPAITVFMDFSDAMLIDDAVGEPQRSDVVVGLAPGRIRAQCRGPDVECLQVRLSPVVAHAVLGAGSELGGSVVALEDLWGRDAVRTHEQLQAARSWDERFAIVAATLARRCEAGWKVDPEVAYIWGQMATTRGRIRIEPLATEVGWSHKRLWTRFRAQIGLTPKHAARLVRFDYAVRRLAAGHSAAVVAADSGFADQSHLYRDVMAFAGVTAKAVGDAQWLEVDDVAWPGASQAAQMP
jgi:AraC-like DNA-binding protein